MRVRILSSAIALAALAGCSDSELPTGPLVAPQMAVTETNYDCTGESQIPQSECEALVALYNSTNGAGWTNHAGWLETTTPCSWYAVFCTGGGIVSLLLFNNQLTGTLPPGLGDLTNLNYLFLDNNQLSGSIPAKLGNLSSLLVLALAANNFTGSIPADLGKLPHLYQLSLSFNQLTGEIPSTLGNISTLTDLNLAYNHLTGSIPNQLGNLTIVAGIELDNNQLTGPIPPELGNLANLSRLRLANNGLTGTIPAALGNLTNLEQLVLNDNQLEGSIPAELGNLTNLTGDPSRSSQFDLSNNQLIGLTPVGMAVLGGAMQQNYFYSCRFTPGNSELFMPDLPEYRAADLDHDGYICGLPFTATPETAATDLTSRIDNLNDSGVLNGGQTNALTKKIAQALKQYDKRNLNAAVGVLVTFVEQVNDLTADGVLTAEQAEPLVTEAEILIELIQAALAS